MAFTGYKRTTPYHHLLTMGKDQEKGSFSHTDNDSTIALFTALTVFSLSVSLSVTGTY